jgi:hypothetical protein
MGAGMGTGGAKHSLVKNILSSIPLAVLRSAPSGPAKNPQAPAIKREAEEDWH